MAIFLKNTFSPSEGNDFLSQLLGRTSSAETLDLALLQELSLQTSPHALFSEIAMKNQNSAFRVSLKSPSEEETGPSAAAENSTTSFYRPYSGSASRSPDDEIALAFDLAREFGGCKSLTQVGYLFYVLQNFQRAIKFQTTSWSII